MSVRRRNLLPLLLILIAAAALRIWLATAQLPYHYHSDEFQIVERALRVGAGEFNPGLFTWPGSFVIYLNFVAFAVYFLVVKAAGVVTDAEAFANLYWAGGGSFYLISRLISCGFALAAISAAAKWAKTVYGPTAAVIAAALYAFAPVTVTAGALTLPDMAAAAMGTWALAFAARYFLEPRIRWAVAVGVCFGLSAAAKYHALLLAPAAILAILSASSPRRWRHLAVGIAGTAASFLIACPFAILDAPSFVADLVSMTARPRMARFAPDLGFVVNVTFADAVSWALVGLTVVGVIFALVKRRGRAFAVPALAAAPFLFLALLRPLPPRHILPLVAPIILIATAPLAAAVGSSRRGIKRAGWVVTTGALAFLLGQVITNAANARPTDTRTLALTFIERHIPAGTTLILEYLEPDAEAIAVKADRDTLSYLTKYYRQHGGGSPGRYGYLIKNPAYPFGKPTYRIVLARDLGSFHPTSAPAFAISTVFDDPAYFAEQGKRVGATLTTWNDDYNRFIDARGRRVARFDGAHRPGPTIDIYRLNAPETP